ncbi:MAG: hypothetical protein LBP89_07435 [Helicobacteraceae bacterium]|jgi:hypothetical protein|nr:hypothetical protein [Helicobacteraceae bacterium]
MKKRVFCLLSAIALLCGCDDGNRHSDDRTGTSIAVIDKITLSGTTARSQIKVSLGDNQSGYISVLIGGYSLIANEYLTKEQADRFDKRLVCDATLLGGGLASFRCGWTQRDLTTGEWSGVLGNDWSGASASRIVSLSSDTLNVEVLVGDRREGFFALYFTLEGYLF